MCSAQASGVKLNERFGQLFLLTLPRIKSIGCYTAFETELSTEQSGREATKVPGALT